MNGLWIIVVKKCGHSSEIILRCTVKLVDRFGWTYYWGNRGPVVQQDRTPDSYFRLGAAVETPRVELLKFGETLQVKLLAIPSEVPKGKRVETWRAASKPTSVGMMKGKSSARTLPYGGGNESCSVTNLEVTGSNPVRITTFNLAGCSDIWWSFWCIGHECMGMRLYNDPRRF